MRLSWETLPLELRTTFRIAHGASDRRDNVLVHLDEGLGEAAAVAYHGETQAGIMAYLADVEDIWGDDPCLLEDVLARLPAGSAAARQWILHCTMCGASASGSHSTGCSA